MHVGAHLRPRSTIDIVERVANNSYLCYFRFKSIAWHDQNSRALVLVEVGWWCGHMVFTTLFYILVSLETTMFRTFFVPTCTNGLWRDEPASSPSVSSASRISASSETPPPSLGSAPWPRSSPPRHMRRCRLRPARRACLCWAWRRRAGNDGVVVYIT